MDNIKENCRHEKEKEKVYNSVHLDRLISSNAEKNRRTKDVSQNDEPQIPENARKHMMRSEEDDDEESKIASSTSTFVDQESPSADMKMKKKKMQNSELPDTKREKKQKRKYKTTSSTRGLADSKEIKIKKRKYIKKSETKIEPSSRVLRKRKRSENEQNFESETVTPSRGFDPNARNTTNRTSQNVAAAEAIGQIVDTTTTTNNASQNGSLVSGSYFTVCTQHGQPHELVVFRDKDISIVVTDLLKNNNLRNVNGNIYILRMCIEALHNELKTVKKYHRAMMTEKNILQGQVNMLKINIEATYKKNDMLKKSQDMLLYNVPARNSSNGDAA